MSTFCLGDLLPRNIRNLYSLEGILSEILGFEPWLRYYRVHFQDRTDIWCWNSQGNFWFFGLKSYSYLDYVDLKKH